LAQAVKGEPLTSWFQSRLGSDEAGNVSLPAVSRGFLDPGAGWLHPLLQGTPRCYFQARSGAGEPPCVG